MNLFFLKFYELLFGHGTINMRKYPKSIKYLYVVTSVFFLFMLSFFYLVSFLQDYNEQNVFIILQSTFFAFLMAVPYEKPIDTLENVVQRTDRAHFCGGEIHFFKFLRKYFIHYNRRILRELIFPSDFSFKKEDL